jgi:iron complex outermembrane receptor protein
MAVARGLLAAALGGALSAVPLVAQAQTGTVTGRVVDSTSQQPLANVTVRIEGTQLGALSRPDGSFTIGGVPTGARSVRAARVGFAARSATVNVTAGGSATVTFNLTPLATQLTEVVAVAYSAGTQDRRNVTGSVAAVDSTLFNKGRVVSAEDLIQAKVAGVQVVSSNEPGGGISVRVRGQASVNGNTDPLFVIDGIPLPIGGGLSGGRNPLNFLNPQDIANVTVLKDAQATAIYGSRGANGVVLITTKNGSRNAPQVTYGVNYSNRTVANAPTLLNSDQFRQVVTQYGPAANVALLQNNNTNWFDALKQTGGGQEHNLAFSGVRQDLQYRLSLGFLGDEGVLRGDNTNRISAQFNYADKLFNNVLDVQSTLRGVRTRDVFSGGRFLGEILGSAPTNPIRNPDGSFFATTNQLAPRNPLALIAAQRSNGQTDRAIGNLQTRANLPFLPGLSATVRGSFDAARTRQTEFTPRSDPSQAFVADTSRGRYYQNLPDATTLVLDAFGNYTRRVNAIGADLDVTGGYSYETSTGNNASFTALGLGSDALGTSGIPAANRVLTPPVNIQERRLASFFGRANATIAERYLFGVSVRRDGSSRFGTNNQWGTFPAVSVGWRAYEESFLRGKLPGLSDLKFRYSYGINGNEPPGNYLAYSTYSYSIPQSQVQFGNVFIPTLAPSTANPNLRWEESRTHNVGVDYGLFDNRITGTVEYYNKLTTDLLFNAPVPGGSNFNNRCSRTRVGAQRRRRVQPHRARARGARRGRARPPHVRRELQRGLQPQPAAPDREHRRRGVRDPHRPDRPGRRLRPDAPPGVRARRVPRVPRAPRRQRQPGHRPADGAHPAVLRRPERRQQDRRQRPGRLQEPAAALDPRPHLEPGLRQLRPELHPPVVSGALRVQPGGGRGDVLAGAAGWRAPEPEQPGVPLQLPQPAVQLGASRRARRLPADGQHHRRLLAAELPGAPLDAGVRDRAERVHDLEVRRHRPARRRPRRHRQQHVSAAAHLHARSERRLLTA